MHDHDPIPADYKFRLASQSRTWRALLKQRVKLIEAESQVHLDQGGGKCKCGFCQLVKLKPAVQAEDLPLLMDWSLRVIEFMIAADFDGSIAKSKLKT